MFFVIVSLPTVRFFLCFQECKNAVSSVQKVAFKCAKYRGKSAKYHMVCTLDSRFISYNKKYFFKSAKRRGVYAVLPFCNIRPAMSRAGFCA